MTLRPPLQTEGRYVLTAGIAAVAAAAAMVIAAILLAPHLDDGTPTHTTYIVGPDGDDVIITPRASP